MADSRKNIDIPVGFVAFYNPNSKKVTGITEFKFVSRAFTELSLLVKSTKEELMTEIAAQGLSYTPPLALVPPTTPVPPISQPTVNPPASPVTPPAAT